MNILQSDSIFKSIWLLPIIGGSRVSWKLNLINTVSQSTPLAVSPQTQLFEYAILQLLSILIFSRYLSNFCSMFFILIGHKLFVRIREKKFCSTLFQIY